jgi:hypothetical protein
VDSDRSGQNLGQPPIYLSKIPRLATTVHGPCTTTAGCPQSIRRLTVKLQMYSGAEGTAVPSPIAGPLPSDTVAYCRKADRAGRPRAQPSSPASLAAPGSPLRSGHTQRGHASTALRGWVEYWKHHCLRGQCQKAIQRWTLGHHRVARKSASLRWIASAGSENR